MPSPRSQSKSLLPILGEVTSGLLHVADELEADEADELHEVDDICPTVDVEHAKCDEPGASLPETQLLKLHQEV